MKTNQSFKCDNQEYSTFYSFTENNELGQITKNNYFYNLTLIIVTDIYNPYDNYLDFYEVCVK